MAPSASEYRELIKAHHLDQGIDALVLPEWGPPKKGKVRDVYFQGENVVMVTNDRVSAFDFVLPNLVPFKGQVLNRWGFFVIAYWVRRT